MKYSVFEYLNLKPEEKLSYFMSTISSLNFMADYWVNFEKVRKNLKEIDIPELYTIDYLIGKSDNEIKNFLTKNPNILILIPKLLGIRDGKLTKDKKLIVQDIDGTYELDFKNIDKQNIDLYFKFIHDSGLLGAFRNGLNKSFHDYTFGVEAGMDSNARKNRSGKMGENFLEKLLEDIAKKKNILYSGQINAKKIKKLYGLQLDDSLKNRKFDGSLYIENRKQLYLFEINNFNGNGSKSKASATEFKDLSNRFAKTNHEFIYITDGLGWTNDKSHLLEAMEHIGKVFNYNMVENGYIENYIN